jgi:hypothetical protein
VVGGGGDLEPALDIVEGSLKFVLVNRHHCYGDYVAVCGTRIRYTRLLVHLISGDLAGGVEEDGDSSDRRFHKVVDLVYSTCVTSLVLEVSDRFKG